MNFGRSTEYVARSVSIEQRALSIVDLVITENNHGALPRDPTCTVHRDSWLCSHVSHIR